MTLTDYYTAPEDEVFDEIKKVAIDIWGEYDNTYGYASEKIGRIEGLQNIEDNAWYIVSMFDPINQRKLLERVSEETRAQVLSALDLNV